jgi:hypothetical protein
MVINGELRDRLALFHFAISIGMVTFLAGVSAITCSLFERLTKWARRTAVPALRFVAWGALAQGSQICAGYLIFAVGYEATSRKMQRATAVGPALWIRHEAAALVGFRPEFARRIVQRSAVAIDAVTKPNQIPFAKMLLQADVIAITRLYGTLRRALSHQGNK